MGAKKTEINSPQLLKRQALAGSERHGATQVCAVRATLLFTRLRDGS
jgi:hypothetical protein